MPSRRPQITKIAREKFGFETLRPGQLEAVDALLDGRDTLVVQPTGSGKSAIYQIAGLLIEGSTVIVSPLIALQKDQVDSIAGQDLPEAVAVNSTLPVSEIREHLDRVQQDEIEYLFLAPEQLRKPETVANLKAANISLFVVDEAHCISAWGHDFRPDYLRLSHVIEALGHPRILALTATASSRVREEIVSRLRMQRPRIFVQGFDRPNIYLRVDHFESEAEKRDALIHRVLWAEKPGIVYTATRKAAEEIMRALGEQDVTSVFYHGGLKPKERHEVQERFMSGGADVIVATTAFGMGVDKPNVRFVYHYDPSDSLDSYYQEIGRAGRDGEKSEAVLFYRRQDIGAQAFKTGEGKVDESLLEELAGRVAAEPEVEPDELAGELGISERKLTSALQRLEDADGSPQLAAEAQETYQQGRRDRLEQMRAYGETSGCRRELILRYFGDNFEGPCNACDNCEARSGIPPVDSAAGTRREVV